MPMPLTARWVSTTRSGRIWRQASVTQRHELGDLAHDDDALVAPEFFGERVADTSR